MRLLLLAGLCVLAGFGAARAVEPSQLHAALDAADSAAMTRLVEEIYEDAGVSLDDALTWSLAPFTETFNRFAYLEDQIILGSIPGPDEVDDYWDNWSRVLTGGRWQRTEFFSDAEAARSLAAYNQLVLAIHELGHAVTYRYDFDHLARHNYSINCREFYADRLTAAALQDLADADSGFADLRTRYIAIMASMNAAVAEADRYHIESLAALEADCTLIQVAQPTPETLQPYASAFFERQRLLLGAELPSLAEMAQTHLLSRLDAFWQDNPVGPEGEQLELATLRTIPAFQPANQYSGNEGYFAPGFTRDGTLYFAELLHEAETSKISLRYGEPGAVVHILDDDYGRAVDDLTIVGMAPVSADHFFLVISEAIRSISVLEAKRGPDGWMLSLLFESTEYKAASLLIGPDGTLHILMSPDGSTIGANTGWVDLALDPVTLEPQGNTAYEIIYGLPVGIHPSGSLITAAFCVLYDFDPDARFWVLAGGGLSGSKDGPVRKGEFVDIVAAQSLPDGRYVLLDRTPDRQSGRLRELRPVKPR